MEHNVFDMLVKWLSLLTSLGEPCHVVPRKLGLALEAAGQVHGDYLADVGRQRALYNGARQWKDLKRCVQKQRRRDTSSGLRLIPAIHRIRRSQANARRNKVFLANVPWVVTHLDFKTHLTSKECTRGSLVGKSKCEVGAHLGLSCALRCLCACLLCVLHAK